GLRRNCPRYIVKRDLGGFLGERFHHADAVLRMAHLHTDMERLDFHVALTRLLPHTSPAASRASPSISLASPAARFKVCEIVIESATIESHRFTTRRRNCFGAAGRGHGGRRERSERLERR